MIHRTSGRPVDESAAIVSPFGELTAAELSPQVQLSFYYGANDEQIQKYNATGGDVVYVNSMATPYSGTSVGGYCVIRSNDFYQGKPGQAGVLRGSALFSTPGATQVQWIGFGSLENKISIGYNGTSFGVNRRTGGTAQIATLTVSVASTAGTAVVTLNGVAFNVSLTGIGTTAGDAFEIANGTFTGWRAEQIGSTVTFQAESIGAKSSTYSYVGVTAGAGTFAATRVGTADVDDWVYQTNFSEDKLDGTGPSGMLLNPQKGNNYQISFTGSDFGEIEYSVENPRTHHYIQFHRTKYSNNSLTPSPLCSSMQMEIVAASLGGTTNVSVSCPGLSAYTLSRGGHVGFPHATSNSKSLTTTLANLFSVKMRDVYGGKINFKEIQLKYLSISTSSSGTRNGLVSVLRNATVAGNQNYAAVDANSAAIVSTVNGAVTGGSEIASIAMPSTGAIVLDLTKLSHSYHKDDTLTVAAITSSGTIEFTAALTWEEDE